MAEIEQEIAESTAPKTSVNQRKWKTFFVKPEYQMPYIWHQAVGGVFIFGLSIFLVHLKVFEIDALMNQEQVSELPMYIQVDAQVQINWLYAEIVTIIMTSFAIHVVYACFVMLLVSHRVTGPMVAIVDIIEQFGKGNYNYKRSIRNDDELVPIHRHLQVLSERLLEKESLKQSTNDSNS